MEKKNHYELIKNIIDKWDLNKLNDTDIKLGHKIAGGGQGKVMLGKYYNMNVIVKILHKINTIDYTIEVRNAYKYRHPNIPKFIGVYESGDTFGVVLEHVDGITLSKLIQCEKQKVVELTLIQKLDYLIQLASVIEFLHNHNLIHRDLKPDNIMIDHLGGLKLLDFGIAIQGQQKWINTDSSEYSLTPSYKAPEIAIQECGDEEQPEMKQDEDLNDLEQTLTKEYKSQYEGEWLLITNKYDVWTFGIIMAELFTRCKPWGRNEKEQWAEYDIVSFLLEGYPYPLYRLYPEKECSRYEKEIKSIIQKCLIHDPKERKNIQEIKDDLIRLFFIEITEKYKEEKSLNLKMNAQTNQKIKQALDKSSDAQASQIIRNNKMICRKEINVELINSLNNVLVNGEMNGTTTNEFTPEMKMLIDKINKKGNQSDLIRSSLLDSLRRANLQKAQRIRIIEHNIAELKDKAESILRSENISCMKLIGNTKSGFKTKTYVYMTYNEFKANILAYEFYPTKGMQSIPLGSNSRIQDSLIRQGYRNPSCLNYKERLYITGGLILNQGNAEDNCKNLRTQMSITIEKQAYMEIFGSNYIPSNMCFCFDYFTKEIKVIPNLAHPRSNHSTIIFRGYLYIVGGNTTICEYLDLANLDHPLHNSFFSAGELLEELYDPLLLNYNNTQLIAMHINKEKKVMAYILKMNSCKWRQSEIYLDLNHYYHIELSTLPGIYYNSDNKDRFFILANCHTFPLFDKEETKSSPFKRQKSKLDFVVSLFSLEFFIEEGALGGIDVNFKAMNEVKLDPSVKNKTKDIMSTYDTSESDGLSVHNFYSFYEWNDELCYFSLNKENKEITFKRFDMDSNSIY